MIVSKVFFAAMPFLLTDADPGIPLAMATFLAAVASMEEWKQKVVLIRFVLFKTPGSMDY